MASSEYWTISRGVAIRTGWSCRDCRQVIMLNSPIVVRDGRKMRLFYHAECFSGSADPRTQPNGSWKKWPDGCVSAQAPEFKGYGKWAVKSYGYNDHAHVDKGSAPAIVWGLARREIPLTISSSMQARPATANNANPIKRQPSSSSTKDPSKSFWSRLSFHFKRLPSSYRFGFFDSRPLSLRRSSSASQKQVLLSALESERQRKQAINTLPSQQPSRILSRYQYVPFDPETGLMTNPTLPEVADKPVPLFNRSVQEEVNAANAAASAVAAASPSLGTDASTIARRTSQLYYSQLAKGTFSPPRSPMVTSSIPPPGLSDHSRSASFNGGQVARDAAFAAADSDTVAQVVADSVRGTIGIVTEDNSANNARSPGHLSPTLNYLPESIDDLESYIFQKQNNLLEMLPEIAGQIARFVKHYPEAEKLVWEQLKPILMESKRRDLLHGRDIAKIEPPVPPARPKRTFNEHGESFDDPFAHFNQRDDPEVLAYLESENQHAEAAMAHTRVLQKMLFREFVTRVDENEESARVTLDDGYTYYTKRIEGEEYAVHCRIESTAASPVEHVYLDENELARQGVTSATSDDKAANIPPSYFRIGFLRHSPDHRMLAYGVDRAGNERYTAYFRDKLTGVTFDDYIENVYEGVEFSKCGKYVFYILLDDFERAWRFQRHELGRPPSEDVLLYEETDEMFFLTLTRSCNGRYLFLNSSAQVTSETRYIPCDRPLSQPRIVFPRRQHVNYLVENHGDYLYVLTNDNVKNNYLFRLRLPADACFDSRTILPALNRDDGEIVVEHRDFVLIEEFQLRARHLILLERSNCLQNVRVVDMTGGVAATLAASMNEVEAEQAVQAAIREATVPFEHYHYVSFSELVYSVWLGTLNEESANLTKHSLFNTNVLRYTYTTLRTPRQVIDYNMDTRVATVVHEEPVLGCGEGGYDPERYTQRRLFATGIDGTAVPLSLVYRKDLVQFDGTNPCLLYGYGAYGYCISPIFNAHRLSLLDRGFVYAIAHIRGGSDMGNAWYEEGKLARKPNTFYDFISVAEYLCKEGYTSREHLAIYGRSAGGLLIGAVVNMRPDLFKAVLTEVPFVDVINTMFDATIPWTAFEYEEWGNPRDRHIYEVMKSYCPYTNVTAQDYPNMLVVAGMNDPRVAYFEPAKFVARLRTTKTDNNLLILRVDDAGHGGSPGQYSHLEELAYEYAFLISSLQAPYKPIGSDYADELYSELENEETSRGLMLASSSNAGDEGADDGEESSFTPVLSHRSSRGRLSSNSRLRGSSSSVALAQNTAVTTGSDATSISNAATPVSIIKSLPRKLTKRKKSARKRVTLAPAEQPTPPRKTKSERPSKLAQWISNFF